MSSTTSDDKSKVAIAGSHRTVCIRAQRGVLSPYKSNENKSPFKSPSLRKSSKSPFRTPQSTKPRSSGTPLSPRDLNLCEALPTKSTVASNGARTSGFTLSKLPMLREGAIVSRQLKKQVEHFRQERQKLLNISTQSQQSNTKKTHADINSLKLKLEEYREQQRLVIRKRQEMLELNKQLLSCEQQAVDMSQRLTCVAMNNDAHNNDAHNNDTHNNDTQEQLAQQISGVLQEVEHQLLCDCLLSSKSSCSICATQCSEPIPNGTVPVTDTSNITDTNDLITSSLIFVESIQQVVSSPCVRVPQNTPFKSASTSGSTLDSFFMQNLSTQLDSVASKQSAPSIAAPQLSSKTASLLPFEPVLQRSGSGQDLFLTRSLNVSIQKADHNDSISKQTQCCTPSRFSVDKIQAVASKGGSRRGRFGLVSVVVAVLVLLSVCLFALNAAPSSDSHMNRPVNQFDQVIQNIQVDHVELLWEPTTDSSEPDGLHLDPVLELLPETVDVTVAEPLLVENEVCDKESVLLQWQSVHLELSSDSVDNSASAQLAVESLVSAPQNEPSSEPHQSIVALFFILMAGAVALKFAVTKTVQRARALLRKNSQQQHSQITVDASEESSQFGTFETFEIRRRRLSSGGVGSGVALSNAFVSPVRRSYRLKGKQTPA